MLGGHKNFSGMLGIYQPLYNGLCFESVDDNRDATIYKSAERGKLKKDFELVASIGDQWSDLLGENRAVAVFKMPNPFYYIP